MIQLSYSSNGTVISFKGPWIGWNQVCLCMFKFHAQNVTERQWAETPQSSPPAPWRRQRQTPFPVGNTSLEGGGVHSLSAGSRRAFSAGLYPLEYCELGDLTHTLGFFHRLQVRSRFLSGPAGDRKLVLENGNSKPTPVHASPCYPTLNEECGLHRQEDLLQTG